MDPRSRTIPGGASRIAALGLALALTTTLSGCDVAGLTDTGGAPEADWTLSTPDTMAGVEPGEEITIDFDLAGASPFEAMLWVDSGTGDGFPVPLVHPTRSTTVWDSRTRLNIHVPMFAAGSHTLAIGDSTGARSNLLDVEVVEVDPDRSAEEMTATIEAAFDGLGRVITRLFRTTDAGGRPLFDTLGPEGLEAVELVARDVGPALGESMARDYRSLGSRDQAQLQALLANTGILDVLDGMAGLDISAGNAPSEGRALQVDPDEWPHLPHAAFYYADLLEAEIAALGPVLDVATIVAALGGPAVALPAGVNVGLAAVRALINTMVPTEITGVVVHTAAEAEVGITQAGQTRLGRPFPALWWLRLRPKNRVIDGITEGAIDILVPFATQMPEGPKDLVTDFLVQIFANVYKSIPDLAQVLESGGDGYLWRVTAAANPRLFTFTAGDLASYAGLINPVLVPFTAPFAATMKLLIAWDVIEDPALAGGVGLDTGDGIPGDPTLAVDWAADHYAVDGVPGSPQGSWDVELDLTAWHMSSRDIGSAISSWLGLYSIPWVDLTDATGQDVRLRNDGAKPDPAVLFETLDATDPDAPVDWVRDEHLESYDPPRFSGSFSTELDGLCPGHETELSVAVNGTPWLIDLQLGGSESSTLAFNPMPLLETGHNEAAITAVGESVCLLATPPRGVDLTVVAEDGLGGRMNFVSEPVRLVDTVDIWMPPHPDDFR